MAIPESLVACFQPIYESTIMRRWTPDLSHLDHNIKDVVDALAALCISKPGDHAAAAIEIHTNSACTIYLAANDTAESLESHFQIIWASLQQIALSTSGASPSLDSPAIDLAVEVYDFAWTAFYEHFAPDADAEYLVNEFIPRVIVPTSKATINDQERRDLQEVGNLFDPLRKAITRTKPANADMKSIFSMLERLSIVLRPYLGFPSPGSLLYRCCDIVEADSKPLWDYLKGVVDISRLIKILLDTAHSAETRSWYTQSLRVVQVPNTRYPFEVNMHDDAVLNLWKDHGGIEGPRADLDAQWNKRLVEPMKALFDRYKPKDVSITSTDGQTIISGSARPHSACALLAHIANLADASPYLYIGLSSKHSCYACYAFFSAYNLSDPKLPFDIKGIKLEFYIPFVFPAFSDNTFNDAVRHRMSTMVENDLWAVWDECHTDWETYATWSDDDDEEGVFSALE